MKFRKKPVVIEAWKIPPQDSSGVGEPPPTWVVEGIADGRLIATERGVDVHTLEGTMTGNVADLRAMTEEMANASYDFEIRFQGHSP